MYPIYHHLLKICEDAKKAPLESISQRMRLHPSTNPPTWRDPRIAWLSATIGHRESWGLRYDWKDGSSMSVEILKNVFIAALATNCHCNSWILWGSSRAPFHNCRHVPFLQWDNDLQKWIAHHFLENIKANGSDISKSKRYCDHVPLDNKLQFLFAARNLLAHIVPHWHTVRVIAWYDKLRSHDTLGCLQNWPIYLQLVQTSWHHHGLS